MAGIITGGWDRVAGGKLSQLSKAVASQTMVKKKNPKL